MRAPLLIVMLLLSGGSSCAWNAARVDQGEPLRPVHESERPFAPGDVIWIQVVNHPELSVRQGKVGPEGEIVVPKLGRVPAAGLSPSELKARIQSGLRAYVAYRRVFVVVHELRPAAERPSRPSVPLGEVPSGESRESRFH